MKFSRFNSFLLGLLVMAFVGLQGCADPCADVTCENGGACVEGICDCAEGYEGTNCETEIRGKFIASYATTETCSSAPGVTFNIPLTISASSAGALKVVLTNLYDTGLSVVADVQDNSLAFTNAPVAGVDPGVIATATGTATLVGDVLTINYTLTSGAISDNCQLSATKQ